MVENDEQHPVGAGRSSSDLTPDEQAQAPATVAGPHEVVGHTLGTDKLKTIEVEVDGREAIVRIGREGVRLDRHSIPTLQQLLQRAFMEVS